MHIESYIIMRHVHHRGQSNRRLKSNWRQNNLRMFGKTKCKLCGDEVRLALKHLRDKHGEIYRKEVASKIKMSDVMKKYFLDC
jgi:hypothetical protein